MNENLKFLFIVVGSRFKLIEQRLHQRLREQHKGGRLYHIVPFDPNMTAGHLRALEWASTVCKLSAKRSQKDDKFKEAKDEGAKLAQWLIDTDLDESGRRHLMFESFEKGNRTRYSF